VSLEHGASLGQRPRNYRQAEVDVSVETIKGAQLAVRASTAASISFAIAQFFALDYPIFAFVAAVIATDLTPQQSRLLGLRRIVATIVGAICGAALSLVLAPAAWTLGLSVLVAMIICHLLGARDGSRVAGYICGLIVLEHSAAPWIYAYHRFIETLLGVLVAWAISYVPKLIRIEESDGQKT
jgi:uncharacterized membrane protein YgaE (UPF0421/DUF939 family)